MDEFSFAEVNGDECMAVACTSITNSFLNSVKKSGGKYLCICVPCYNENIEEFTKTILSLMENMEFIQKKVRNGVGGVDYDTICTHKYFLTHE